MLILRPTGIIAGRIRRREDVRERRAQPERRLDQAQHAAGARARARMCLAAASLFAPLLLNAFGGGGLLSSLVIAGIFFIALLGLDVLMGYCGQVSLGHAAFMATGGYMARDLLREVRPAAARRRLRRPRRLADLRDGALAGHGRSCAATTWRSRRCRSACSIDTLDRRPRAIGRAVRRA